MVRRGMRLLAAILLIAATPALAQDRPLTAADLAVVCQDPTQRQFCLGFLAAAAEYTLSLADENLEICPPPIRDIDAMRRAFLAFVDGSTADLPAVMAISGMLVVIWPC